MRGPRTSAPQILRNCTPTWYNFRCPKNSRNSFSDSSRSQKFKIKASASLHCPEAVRESPPLPLPGSGGPRYSLVVATWLHLASVFTQPSPLSSVNLSSVWHLSWDLGLTQVTTIFHSSAGKEPAFDAGDPGLIPGWKRSPGERNGSPFHYSFLENPMDREA